MSQFFCSDICGFTEMGNGLYLHADGLSELLMSWKEEMAAFINKRMRLEITRTFYGAWLHLHLQAFSVPDEQENNLCRRAAAIPLQSHFTVGKEMTFSAKEQKPLNAIRQGKHTTCGEYFQHTLRRDLVPAVILVLSSSLSLDSDGWLMACCCCSHGQQ